MSHDIAMVDNATGGAESAWFSRRHEGEVVCEEILRNRVIHTCCTHSDWPHTVHLACQFSVVETSPSSHSFAVAVFFGDAESYVHVHM